jgi:hypothetical protein
MDHHDGNENGKGRLLIGAAQIALAIYGDAKCVRKVYHIAATSNAPFTRVGSRLGMYEADLQDYLRPKRRRDDDNNP